MSYTLQPGLERVENPAVPPACATDYFFSYPIPSQENYCCRPNTVVYGTAPYMAGKGAPNELVMVEDQLRPQSTTRFGKIYAKPVEKELFPLQDMSCSQPLRSRGWEAASSRGDVQNALFQQRYCSK